MKLESCIEITITNNIKNILLPFLSYIYRQKATKHIEKKVNRKICRKKRKKTAPKIIIIK